MKNTSHDISQGQTFHPTSKVAAVLLALVLCAIYYGFKSNTLIGDGLRYLPVLRTIVPGEHLTIQPKPWVGVYRDHYNDLVVHNHFLFGATMSTAFAFQHKLGVPGDATVAMQVVNSVSAAIAAALFFLLGLRLGLPRWISLVVTLGFSLSPAYLLAGTNITETALALPFFIGTLLLLADREFSGWTPVAAGVLAGLAAIFYAISGFLVPGIAAAVILSRFPSRSALRPFFLFLSGFGVIFVGIWVTVLVAAGYHTLGSILGAIFQFPQQGTFIKFRVGSLVATAVGLTQAFLPVLPDDFVGLQSLMRGNVWIAVRVGLATLFVCVFLSAIFYSVFKHGLRRDSFLLSSFLTFLLVEAACTKWDTYYQKLHLFALVLCWVMVLVVVSRTQTLNIRWPAFFFVLTVSLGGLWVLRKNTEPSQMRANAQQLQQIVGTGELITSWTGDVLHMFLYSNGDNVISLPELAFASHLDTEEAREKLQAEIQRATTQGRRVYFYGLFKEEGGGSSDIYEARFREKGMTAYLGDLQRRSRPVVHLPQQSGGTITLYVYVP